MSILATAETRAVIVGGKAGVSAAKRMAEFNYLIQSPLTVEAFVYPPDAGTTVEILYGNQYRRIPVYSSVAEAKAAHQSLNTALIYVGAERAFSAAMESLETGGIEFVTMITEGLPERDAKLLTQAAKRKGKLMNGPSAIGVLSAGQCRLGVIGGEFSNLKLSRLHRAGSFGVITKSGGLASEIIWMCAQFADGITTAVSIGGDAFPCTDFVTYLNLFERDEETKAVVLVGEMGGELEEEAAAWLSAKPRRIRLLAAVGGTCQSVLPAGMKFGHAGAKEGRKRLGSAKGKIDALRFAGALVPETFGGLGAAIQSVYQDLLSSGAIRPYKEKDISLLPSLPKQVDESMRRGEVLVEPLVRTTISDDRGEEPLYAGYAASELCDKGYGIEHIVGLLWNKRLLSKTEVDVVRRILMLSADHGPAVSGALVTIIAACAGIQMAQAVAAGMSMIGPRFGGAVSDAGKYFKYGLANYPNDVLGFLAWMKTHVGPVPGIGHRVKSLRNPDKRVRSLVEFVKAQPNLRTPHLDYALQVELTTTAKKDTLILNLDGAIAAILVDLGFAEHSLNGFFILARTIGFVGHWIDQKEQNSRLMRLYDYLVNYAAPKKRDVPELK